MRRSWGVLTGLRVTACIAFLGIVYSGIAPGFSSPGETMELIGGSALFNTSHPQPPPGGGLIWTLAAVAQERMPDPSPVGEPRDALGPVTPPSFSVIEIAPDGHIRFEGRGTPGTRVTLNRYGQPLASAMVSANGDWTVNLGQRIGSGVHEFSSLATKPNYGVPIAGSDVRIAIPSGFSAAGRNGEEAVPPADSGLGADVRSRAKDRARDAAEQFSQLQRPQLSQASLESRAKTDRADGTDKEPGKEGGWTFWLQDWLASSNRDFQGKIVRPLQLPKPDPADVEAADTQPAPTKDEVKQSEAAKNAEAKAEAEAAARGKAERIAAERATKAKAEAELLAAERRERAERRAAAAADAHDAQAARQAEAQRQAEEQSQRHAERERQIEVDQRAEAERRAEAQRQQAAAEDARRQLEAQVQAEAEAEARQRERRLREERERALLAAEAEAKRRRAEAEAAAEANRRRATEQRIAAKAERARQLHEIARDDAARSAPAPTRQRETPRMGLRGGDVMPDDGAETSVRATDGYVMPEGWRRLAQRDGNSRSMPVSTSTRTTAGNPDRDARAPRVLGMARRANNASCRRAGKRIRPPGTYVVRYGDSLWVISRRHYRKGKYWPVIYRANGAEIDDPDLIYPCQRLHLPKLGRGRR